MTLHPRADNGVGRAARLQMIERLLDRLRAAGARYARCDDLAREHAAAA